MAKNHTIDAAGKKLGRIASEAAALLMGKDEPTFQKHLIAGSTVTIHNASKLAVSEKKLTEKVYTHYTGFPGGLREQSMTHLVEKKGYAEAIRKAVYGMLPANKLRDPLMKNLIVEE